MSEELPETEEEWKEKLDDEEYQVLRKKGTEPKFSGEFLDKKDGGTYRCKACGSPIFDSDTKFDSNSGWPSFYDAIEGSVEFKRIRATE
jgi:peptide-methionine (R)-S-oxide reductase